MSFSNWFLFHVEQFRKRFHSARGSQWFSVGHGLSRPSKTILRTSLSHSSASACIPRVAIRRRCDTSMSILQPQQSQQYQVLTESGVLPPTAQSATLHHSYKTVRLACGIIDSPSSNNWCFFGSQVIYSMVARRSTSRYFPHFVAFIAEQNSSSVTSDANVNVYPHRSQ